MVATRSKRNLIQVVAATALTGLGLVGSVDAEACTRVLYSGAANTVITGRSMDWYQDNAPNLWAMPRGMSRDGATGPDTIRWTSKFGSLVVSMYDLGTVDGINDKGLVANTLYLAESNYGKPEGKPTLSIAAWAQYVLDNYGSVSEAVAALRQEPFRIIAPLLPGGKPAQGHLSLSDPSGDSAILEYVNGKLVIHHGKQYTVMTNSPTYDQQLALNSYWQQIGGTVFLPGTSRASDRFARASFLLGAIPKDKDPNVITAVPNQSFAFQAMASVLGVMRSVSVPLGIRDPKQPNISSTFWRTTYDHKDRILIFDSATAPSAFWVKMEDLNLNPGQPVRRLKASGGRTYNGDVGRQFEPAKPFTFLPGQLALNSYWQQIGGTVFLPGTSRASDRFARASFLLGAIPKDKDPNVITAVPNQSFAFQAMASVLGVMRSVSVPLGIRDPKQPNISSTFWRTTYDHKDRILIFDSATAPSAFWVKMEDLNLNPGQPVRRLKASGGRTYNGDVGRQFEPAKPFTFLPGQPVQ